MRALEELVNLLKVLGDPTRLKLLKFVTRGELCNCELVELLGISQPGVSQHLSKLKAVGLIKERRQGQWVYFSADPERLARFAALWHGFLAADPANLPELESEQKRRLQQRQSRRCE